MNRWATIIRPLTRTGWNTFRAKRGKAKALLVVSDSLRTDASPSALEQTCPPLCVKARHPSISSHLQPEKRQEI